MEPRLKFSKCVVATGPHSL